MRAQEQPVPILLLAQALGQGGSERQLTEVAKALDRSRFRVHAGYFRDGGFRIAELAGEGIPLLYLPVHSFKSFSAVRAAWSLRRYLRQHRIRLVHTFDTPMNCFAAPVAKACGVPVVLSSQRASRSLSQKWERSMLRFTDRLVDAVVVNCDAMRRHMLEDEGIDSARLRVCYNGLDTQRYRLEPKQRPPVLENASLVIGVVCALRPEKGLPTLVEAFARVVKGSATEERAGVRLLIVGSGGMLETLRQTAARLEISAQCHFEPSTPDVATWLHAIDIFVLPSLSEALSNSLMEAMACGCAPVASRVGGNPELVTEEITGLLFQPGNAAELAERLERLIADQGLRNRMAAHAAEGIARRFSREASVAKMGQIYDELLNRI